MSNTQKQKKIIIETPRGFYISDGRPAKTIARLGSFDKPDTDLLKKNNADATSFNFFIKWNDDYSDGTMIPEIWIKRIFTIEDTNDMASFNIENSDVIEKLEKLEGKEHIISATKLFGSIGIKLRYLLINNISFESANDEAFVGYYVDYLVNEDIFGFEKVSINKLKASILKYTGRKLQMGKRLNVSETYLESYLSTTDTPFPGDCDELIYSDGKIIAILEYKKCTGRDKVSVEDQSFERFSGKDRIKYQRINILRNYLAQKTKHNIPLINILYSVEEDDRKVKLEKIKPDLSLDTKTIFEVSEIPEDNKAKLWQHINMLTNYSKLV